MLTKKCCFKQIRSFVWDCLKSWISCGELLIGPLSMSGSEANDWAEGDFLEGDWCQMSEKKGQCIWYDKIWKNMSY